MKRDGKASVRLVRYDLFGILLCIASIVILLIVDTFVWI
jgi:hypothetical protein